MSKYLITADTTDEEIKDLQDKLVAAADAAIESVLNTMLTGYDDAKAAAARARIDAKMINVRAYLRSATGQGLERLLRAVETNPASAVKTWVCTHG